ncbi:MAG: type II CRISPR-associated endonuclease Cas1 [Phycisphaerae bacterium]|nr:type II CRISPR-associated endonuclease Cas1 [Phycisphaerae bacterium]
MIKRTVEISSSPCRLSLRQEQMILQREGQDDVSIPCEDIGVLVLDQPAVSVSGQVLTALLEKEAVILLCGPDHLPAGMLVPFSANLVQTQRFREQIAAKLPLQKQLWKQIVQAKIRHQADLLGKDHPDYSRLIALTYRVKSADTSNVEAQAARIYWQAIFCDSRFRRKREGDAPNNFLNYGYAVLRAAVARALCCSGLHPSIGIHHRNKYNAYALADDLMEPFRPMVDARARQIALDGKTEIDRDVKAHLLAVLTDTVQLGDTAGPFMVALPRMTASLARCFAGEQKTLEIPQPCESPDTGPCG